MVLPWNAASHFPHCFSLNLKYLDRQSHFLSERSHHTRWHCRVYYILRFEMCQHHSLCQGCLWRWSKTASWQIVQLFGGNFKTWHDGLVIAARSGLLQIKCKICFELGFLFCKKKSAKIFNLWCICFRHSQSIFAPIQGWLCLSYSATSSAVCDSLSGRNKLSLCLREKVKLKCSTFSIRIRRLGSCVISQAKDFQQIYKTAAGREMLFWEEG